MSGESSNRQLFTQLFTLGGNTSFWLSLPSFFIALPSRLETLNIECEHLIFISVNGNSHFYIIFMIPKCIWSFFGMMYEIIKCILFILYYL